MATNSIRLDQSLIEKATIVAKSLNRQRLLRASVAVMPAMVYLLKRLLCALP